MSAQSSQNTRSHRPYARARISTNFTFWFIFGGLALVAAVVNIQPWMSVGEYIAQEVTIIPGQLLIQRLPIVGGWLALMFGALGRVIGGILWGAVQLVQVAPIIGSYPWFMAGSAGKRDFLIDLKKYRVIAYVLEVAALFLHYPPYGEGWTDFAADMGVWDNYLWNWQEIGLIVITMLAFEAVVAFTLKAWAALSR